MDSIFVTIVVFWVVPAAVGFLALQQWECIQGVSQKLVGKHPSSWWKPVVWMRIGQVGAALLIMALGVMQSELVDAQSLAFQVPYIFACIVGLFSALGEKNSFTIVVETTIIVQTVMNIAM